MPQIILHNNNSNKMAYKSFTYRHTWFIKFTSTFLLFHNISLYGKNLLFKLNMLSAIHLGPCVHQSGPLEQSRSLILCIPH